MKTRKRVNSEVTIYVEGESPLESINLLLHIIFHLLHIPGMSVRPTVNRFNYFSKIYNISKHILVGLPDKGRAINGLIVCKSWDLKPLDLLNELDLGCPSLGMMRMYPSLSIYVSNQYIKSIYVFVCLLECPSMSIIITNIPHTSPQSGPDILPEFYTSPRTWNKVSRQVFGTAVDSLNIRLVSMKTYAI